MPVIEAGLIVNLLDEDKVMMDDKLWLVLIIFVQGRLILAGDHKQLGPIRFGEYPPAQSMFIEEEGMKLLTFINRE
jgi:hypothetical protein